jgi:hypothetical protein
MNKRIGVPILDRFGKVASANVGAVIWEELILHAVVHQWQWKSQQQ